MQLNITGHHVDVTDALRSYTAEKLSRLERHFENINNIHVVLSVEKVKQRAEATVHVSGAELFADADSDDMYAAIDLLADKLDRQLLKHKEKLVNRNHGR